MTPPAREDPRIKEASMKIPSVLAAGLLVACAALAAGCCCPGPFCEIPKCDPCVKKANPCDPCAPPVAQPGEKPPAAK